MSDRLAEQLRATLPGYPVERELSGGGMSRVFVAEESALGRRVVIKVLAASGPAVNAERFRREILLSARLQHPHIVPVLTAGEVDGVPYFVMPYVEGASLRARLRQDGALPIAEAVRLLRNVGAALAYAHERGIVHRDIKPDNVIVSGGVAVVLDFGVSKALAASTLAPQEGVTHPGIAVGTPAYMAPEQAAGDPEVDARADLYAFGILAYELLTASTPFGGRDAAQLLRAHLIETPPPLAGRRPEVPPALAALVMRCLEKEKTARPQTATEVLDLLDAMGTPSGTRATTRWEGAARAWDGALAGAIPALVYGVACGITIGGFRWLETQGQVTMRAVVFAIIGALMGLPLVVAAGWLMHIRRTELRPRAARG